MVTADKTNSQTVAQIWLWRGFVLLLLLMPFHATFTTVLGHFFGHRSIFQSWKEGVIVLMGLLWLYDAVRRRRLGWRWDGQNRLAVGLILLAIMVTLFNAVSWRTVLFGAKVDLVPLGLFLLAQTIWPQKVLPKLTKIILIGLLGVVIGGLAQAYILSPDQLHAIGYSASTINPVQLVDPAIKAVRLFATLGGPNQLGAYLILPLCLLSALIIRQKKLWLIPLLGLTLWLSYYSYSRSSWLAVGLGLFLTILFSLRGKWRLMFIAISVVGMVAAGSVAYQTLHSTENTPLQYLLLHGRVNQEDRVEGSDAARVASQQAAWAAVLRRPLGFGLGTAGPASQLSGATPHVTENWYLQIGLELGVIGLVGYLIFWIMQLIGLLRGITTSTWAVALFAALAGLLVTSYFLHTWADSTLSIMFFSLLGLTKRELQT